VRSFFKRVSALAADAFHSTRALRLNDLSNVCAQPRTARARTGAQGFRVQGLRFRRPRTSADGSAEERQAIRSTGTDYRRRTSFAAGMIREELCHVENHALDDEVAALLCPAQRSEEGVMVPRRTVKSQATRAEGGERGVDAVSRGLPAAPHLPTPGAPGQTITPQMLVALALPDLCFAISPAVIVGALFLPRCFAIAASTSAGRLAGESMMAWRTVRKALVL
jgi:hypothetical protein